MKHAHTRLIPMLAVVALSGLLFDSQGRAQTVSPQDPEKSLDIERYPDEPLELVDLRIGSTSVKDAIKTKVAKNAEGLDTVKFNETADWHRRVSLTLRNVSGKPVIGPRAYLYFKAAGSGELFRLQLEQEQAKETAPGAEINLTVGAQRWGLITNLIKQKGADADLAAITLAVEAVLFSDNSQWYRGRLLRRDPASPNTWRPADSGRGSRF